MCRGGRSSRETAASDAVAASIVEDSSAKLGPSLRGSVENLRAGFNKSVSEAFYVGSIDFQLHAENAINGITPFSGGAALEDGGGFTKGENVVDPAYGPEVIEL